MATSFHPSDEETPDGGIVAEINITPLTDVFLVLLIIFMVTTSVISQPGQEQVGPAERPGERYDSAVVSR